jgi:hypothetical protein
MDIEIAEHKHKINWRHWGFNKGKETHDEYSDWVPRNILYFDRFVEELFDTKSKADAFAMIEQAKPFLKSLEGARLRGGAASNTFGNLFTVETVTRADEIDLANPEDEKLRALENLNNFGE